MKNQKSMKKGILPLLAALLLAGIAHPVQAQTDVTIQTGGIGSTNLDGDTVNAYLLGQGGTLVSAYYFGTDYGVLTLNGVAFTGVGSGDTLYGQPWTFGGGAGSAIAQLGTYTNVSNGQGASAAAWSGLQDGGDYRGILQGALISDNAQHTGGAAAPLTLTLNNLVSGQTYQLELYMTSSFSTSQTITMGDLDYAVATGGPNALGSYALLTFTADGASDSLTLSNDNDSVLNAYSLIEEAAAVPEPSTVALLCAGVGLIGLTAVRRFRLASV